MTKELAVRAVELTAVCLETQAALDAVKRTILDSVGFEPGSFVVTVGNELWTISVINQGGNHQDRYRRFQVSVKKSVVVS